MKRQPSETEAFATGFHMAAKSLTSEPSDFTIMTCRRLWTKQRDAAPEGPVRWGLNGMLAALRRIESGEPLSLVTGAPPVTDYQPPREK